VAQENNALFTEEEQGRILYHLGYPQVSISGFLAFGVLALTETMFVAVNALQHVPLTRAMIVRDCLAKCESIEETMFDAVNYLVATKLEQLELRDEHPDLVEKEHTRWATRLADSLGVTVNPYSERFNGNKPRMNVRVRRV
jgi:hypothetical protein